MLTGSSARLHSTEVATGLRGRGITTEILPFSLDEVLRHRGVALPRVWPPPAQVRSQLEHELTLYLQVGGFPEVQGVDAAVRQRILRDQVDIPLPRDVVERHGVSNVAALRTLVRALLSSPAGSFSVHKTYNDMRSQGYQVSKNSLYEYVAHLEDAYLLHTVSIERRSARARAVNPRKCYPADPALARTFGASEDTGHALETLVYLELRRRGYAMSYVITRGGAEVDLLARHPDGRSLLVQVCADLGASATRARELRALEQGLAERPEAEPLVVTLFEHGSASVGGRKVAIVPAWWWLVEGV